MRARKVINRVYRGVTYYRWILSVPPKEILKLGWVDGQPLRAVVRGNILLIEPTVAIAPPRRRPRSSALEENILRRSLGPTTPGEAEARARR